MNKDVIVSISGLQIEAFEGEGADEPIEVITPATYFVKDGTHYIFYEEITEDITGVTQNRIKIVEDSRVEIRKTGIVNTEMLFEKGESNLTYYDTPYGQLLLKVYTTDIQVKEDTDLIEVKIKYELDVNHEPLAECDIKMSIQSRKTGMFKVL
ncbi:DUF1934 domain-containing protein [Lachnospiraceae bacterium OttesenSCG-928-E19]|nr:DUF1934 domain-containing protein [Lachnospiraceae bacterium OttesenSCG-928-E19]